MHPQAAYDLRITIIHSRPKIWRRLIVPADIVLFRLHAVIQIATGASDSRQHFFIDSQKTVYADPSWDDLPKIKSARDAKLNRLLRRPGDRLEYYCGDDDEWEHSVELLKITGAAGKPVPAICLGGSRRHLGTIDRRHCHFPLSSVNQALRRIKV
jgi:hypothetical protein